MSFYRPVYTHGPYAQMLRAMPQPTREELLIDAIRIHTGITETMPEEIATRSNDRNWKPTIYGGLIVLDDCAVVLAHRSTLLQAPPQNAPVVHPGQSEGADTEKPQHRDGR